MTSTLAVRLRDIPGVASVDVDLDDPDSPGIRVKVAAHADEAEVLERVRALLAAYGVRSRPYPPLKIGRNQRIPGQRALGVDVAITPIKGGARVEVIGKVVRSFRIVPPDAVAIAQGVADAWCQVMGRIPMEIVEVSVADHSELVVVASNGTTETVGRSDISVGWTDAIGEAVGTAIGILDTDPMESRLASIAW